MRWRNFVASAAQHSPKQPRHSSWLDIVLISFYFMEEVEVEAACHCAHFPVRSSVLLPPQYQEVLIDLGEQREGVAAADLSARMWKSTNCFELNFLCYALYSALLDPIRLIRLYSFLTCVA